MYTSMYIIKFKTHIFYVFLPFSQLNLIQLFLKTAKLNKDGFGFHLNLRYNMKLHNKVKDIKGIGQSIVGTN